jgi:hypothetical protein
MKNALISPEEKKYKYDGTLLGQRIAEVSNIAFEIAPPLFWIECDDDVIADNFYYDADTNSVLAVPKKPVPKDENLVGDSPNVIA